MIVVVYYHASECQCYAFLMSQGQMWVLCLSDKSRLDVSVVPFWWVKVRCKCCAFPHMIVVVYCHASGCECCAFITSQVQMWVLCLSNESRLDVSAVPFWRVKVRCECCAFSQMIVVVYCHAGECKCCAFLTWCWMCSSHGQMWVLAILT